MTSRNLILACKVSLIVGSILNMVNSFEAIVNLDFTFKNTAKIIFTYCVPFGVSLYSSIKSQKKAA